MSYTMTIEAPEKAAWFEQRRAKFSPEKLGDLFVTFLMQQAPEILEEEKGKSSFARFAGRWTAEEAVAFNELTQRTVDEEDWK